MSKGTSFITAGFRSVHENEAFIFLNDKYVLVNYHPGTAYDEILHGPKPISEGFKFLKGTIFAEYGIDCAFGSSDKGQAYIFKLNKCALIDYSPYSDCSSQRIIKGPMLISEMFPTLKGTVFENGIDGAFEVSNNIPYEVYICSANQYARLFYGPKATAKPCFGPLLSFYCFRGTPFEFGIGAAFATHSLHEAYIFKNEYYARVTYTPGASPCQLITGVKKIAGNWPSLAKLLPIDA